MKEENENNPKKSHSPVGLLERIVKCDWAQTFPEEEGLFWFYGYRFGKVSCGRKDDPELNLVKVTRIANGFMYVADGQFMSENEVESPNFTPVILPIVPDI